VVVHHERRAGIACGANPITPGSVFVRGTTFMGVDLAELLDEQYEKDHPR
jgi:hypothetical protein